MAEGWIEIEHGGEVRREALRPGLTRAGGPGAEIVIAGAGADQLHLWDSPARVVFVGTGERPVRAGVRLEEAELFPGDRLEWHGHVLAYGRPAGAGAPAALEEIHAAVAAPVPAAAPGPAPAEGRAWRRIRAGLLVELGIADRSAASRWQQAVLGGEFDADACARDILARSDPPADDPRVVERAGRLLRDFLMMPLQTGVRGAGRRARQRVRGGLAFLIAQGLALLAFCVLAAIALAVARWQGASIDRLLDVLLFRG
ncbi:MAG: hypothetical protein AB1726_06530 [Planctomycetota bacterium]